MSYKDAPDWNNPNLTYGDILKPTMLVETREEASELLEDYVKYIRSKNPMPENKARKLALENIGYFAGYYSSDVRKRVYELFNTEHPIFGKTDPTPEQAFHTGLQLGMENKNK